MPTETGGQGDLTRSDLALIRQALRQEWPIPPTVKSQILQRLIDYLDREHEEGQTCSDRQVIMAARTLVQFCALGLEQQRLDLDREKLEGSGRRGPADLADLVAEAEKRASKRRRDRKADPPAGGLSK